MEIEEIKKAIQALHFRQVGPLYLWLQKYHSEEIFPREVQADIEELGEEAWAEALQNGMATAGEKRQACLRLMNSMQFRSDADREQCLKDFKVIVGEAMASDDMD